MYICIDLYIYIYIYIYVIYISIDICISICLSIYVSMYIYRYLYDKWCSSLGLKLLKKGPIFPSFYQTRDAANEIATFHPGHNTALKNLS